MSDTTAEKRTYRLVFEAPAVVQFELFVNAENQQTALVEGHDSLISHPLSSGKIVSVSLDNAMNVELTAVEAGKLGAMPSERVDQYEVQLFHGASQKSIAMSVKFPNEKLAETYAKQTLDTDVRYLQARILDPDGQMVMRVTSKRGGHEIRYTENSSGNPIIISNLGSLKAALQKVMDLKNARQSDTFVIYKFNDADRSIEPVLITTVQ